MGHLHMLFFPTVNFFINNSKLSIYVKNTKQNKLKYES